MSRTKKGSKSPGAEYWGKRPHSFTSPVGKFSKKRTVKAERKLKNKDALLEELQRDAAAASRLHFGQPLTYAISMMDVKW